MPGLLGKKIGMTSMFSDEGKNIPCTILEVGPCVVSQIKTNEIDGYEAVQIAYDEQKESRMSKALMGHLKKANSKAAKKMVEVTPFANEVNLGDVLTVDLFEVGSFVTVVGTSKGKGFQGVVKRHGFAGVGDATHGQHNRLRAPGSIGAASYPARVFKGMRMGGRMGGDKVKVQNLKVLKVVAEKNLLVVKGAIPGHKNAFVTIQK